MLQGEQFGRARSNSPEHHIPLTWRPDPANWDDVDAHERLNEAWDDHAGMEEGTWSDLDPDERASRVPSVADLKNAITDLHAGDSGFSKEAHRLGINHVLEILPDADTQMPHMAAHYQELDAREERRKRLLGHLQKIASAEPHFSKPE